jgi:hypothetical protein
VHEIAFLRSHRISNLYLCLSFWTTREASLSVRHTLAGSVLARFLAKLSIESINLGTFSFPLPLDRNGSPEWQAVTAPSAGRSK